MDYETSVKQHKLQQVKGELKPINYVINKYDRSDNDFSNLIFMSREDMVKQKLILPDEKI